jgi:hypothetical protein
MSLPAGFVLEEGGGGDSGLPPGFVLDRRGESPQQPPQEAPKPSFYEQLRAGLTSVPAELGGSAFNAVASGVDVIPNGINAASRLISRTLLNDAVTPYQYPTIQEKLGPSLGNSYMQPGLGRDVTQAAGALIPAAMGMVPVARAPSTASLVADFTGMGSTQPTGIPGLVTQSMQAAPSALDTKLSILRETGDASTAGKMLDSAGNVVKDTTQKAAQWQGFDPGFVAYVKSANPDTKQKMAAMLDIVDQSKKNWRSGLDNRPLNVIGESVLNRLKVVREANRVSGVRLDSVAEGLKGAPVDINPAVDTFLNTLTEMGMKYDPKTKALNLVQGSATQDMPEVQKEAARILNRLQTTRETGKMDAYDVHIMKKWIDNNVDYAKTGEGKSGMIGSLDRAIKGLRHDLDATLDNQFDAYNKVNTQYSETKQALNEVGDIAGKKFDPNDDSAALTMGSLARRFLSNAQSNGYLRDSISNLDTVARKYIKPGTDLVPYKPIQARSGVTPAMLENDDLIGLAGYADELDKHFGAASKTSLFGDVDKAVQRGIDAGTGSMTLTGAAATGLKYGWKKAARINEDRAMKAMRELLRRGE